MMWLGTYQSAICWLFSRPFTSPVQKCTVPQGQIGLRPIRNRMVAITATTVSATNQ